MTKKPKRIMADWEIQEVRKQIERRDITVSGGLTWMIIEDLCDTVDELRRLLAGRVPS